MNKPSASDGIMDMTFRNTDFPFHRVDRNIALQKVNECVKSIFKEYPNENKIDQLVYYNQLKRRG